jgi:N-acetylmuramoyl-L-alanine amidase
MKTSNLVSILLVTCLFGSLSARSNKIKITNGYHHEGAMSDKLVFYFTQRPICNYIPAPGATSSGDSVPMDANGVVELEFFLPITEIANKETQSFITQLNTTNNDLYRVKFESDKQRNGLKCHVAFRPVEIGFHQESFEAIGGQPALAFSFFKRDAMKNLNKKMRPLLRSTQLKKKARIAIDCGHGDKDPGFVTGTVKEKNINLQIGLKTAGLLKKNGYNVFLTRDNDTYLRLDTRTTQTNLEPDVDLFVSIHANATDHKHISGVETFCVQPSLFKQEFAMMDSQVSGSIAVHEKKLHAQSRKLAMAIQEGVLHKARKHNKQVVDRKVKFKPAQVLMGTEVPSVLVELGFLSHAKEGRLLQLDDYQKSLAQGIFNGIEKFLK